MNAFLENDLAAHLPLDGEWSFSLAGSATIVTPVPSAWETCIHDKRIDGPALYRREFDLPAEWLDGRRIVLEANAISFDVTVRVNGQEAGHHQGLWSRFQLDVTVLVRAGRNEIALEIWKPGGRFPLRESLAGFLPDVCTTFGGPWQSLGLRALATGLAGLRVVEAGGLITVRGEVGGSDFVVHATVHDQAGILHDQTRTAPDHPGQFSLNLPAAGLARWRPDAPALVTVAVSVEQRGKVVARASRRLGLRRAHVKGDAAMLDDGPLHLRGVLDWGWHPDLVCPAPSRKTVTRQFQQARSLGFNLVKLCLFVPDETTFDVADEMGMMLWLEMPLWLPRVTPALKQLALTEYKAVLQRLHHHPAIVVVSLGCELNAESDPDFLGQLNALARHWLPNGIHCDNSGSAEAYGGAATTLSDVYDYHFYTDPHFFQPLVEHFDRGYRLRKPWLYGEYCDADTGRDFAALDPLPWWLVDPVPLERDDYLVMREGPARLAAAGVADSGGTLTRIARRQATAIRKFIFEQTRLHAATGGYVMSGLADTPITTSGIVDDGGQLKFDPDEWRDFNADAVLLIDRERRRRWVGGDRPAQRDPFCWWAGERAEIHVLLSNGQGHASGGKLQWSLHSAGGREWAAGQTDVGRQLPAEVRELGVISLMLPETSAASAHQGPLEATLSVALDVTASDGQPRTWRNAWPLWIVPQAILPRPLALAGHLLYDNSFWRLDRESKTIGLADAPPKITLVADALTPDVLDHVHRGGRGLFWLRRPDSRFTRSLPFWREAIHVFEPHRLWDRVAHPGYADMRFFSVATDIALDLARLQAHLGPDARLRPLWRRFDARTLTWAAHLVEVEYGAGRLLVSGLRFEGGQGRQPETFDTNPMGAWMLASLLAELSA